MQVYIRKDTRIRTTNALEQRYRVRDTQLSHEQFILQLLVVVDSAAYASHDASSVYFLGVTNS